MGSHEGWSHGASGVRGGKELVSELFDVDVARVQSLSWSLGRRLTVESDARQRFELESRRTNRSLTVFEASDDTCVLRLRTPVGRERFYGVATVDLEGGPEKGDWVRTE
ncbi:hypothetical protein [Natrialbaceae archaeon AArc-T1-2]|uniref:hypothetical protein n=1 Tax=Natrialbaceae archaeon AArc-T1-2 TaxID=3053904 RepID=UPI00255B121D|nr:hypothetical protein [Natrialbaceae archaeon AArc-T1-2]WIV67659.1 hypothetical protein QQ977_02700 [Natrialbaceae archaeon AArc-T1-2]